jgi:hypothetical protein
MAPITDMDGFMHMEMAFDDWKTRGEYPSHKECKGGWREEAENEKELDDLYFMEEGDLEKLEDYLKKGYESSVQEELSRLVENFNLRWSTNPDGNMLSRELTRYDYMLYPEKHNGEAPYVVTQLPKEVRLLDMQVRKAHFAMTLNGRNIFQTKKELQNSQDDKVDAANGYLSWLLEFQEQLDASNVKEVAPVSVETRRGERFLTHRQAALLLRYSAITVNNKSYDGSNANKLAEEMCGRTKKCSGSELSKKYVETAEKYGHEYHRKLLNGYTAKTTHKRTITNHVENLKAVYDYLESGDVYDYLESIDVYERVKYDYLYLSNEFKSLQ